MKRFGQRIAWYAGRIGKLFGNMAAFVARRLTTVKSGRVVCWAHNFKQYGCNPRYLTEYLLEHHPEMEIWWVFRKGAEPKDMDHRIRTVRFRSWQYLKLMASAEFVVTNARTDPWHIYWHKREKQKYLMLWHGSVSLKQIERDVEHKLGYSYVEKAKRDSKVCDLMISASHLNTQLIRRAFWYDGEILECGTPRNDVLFQPERHNEFLKRLKERFGVDPASRLVLYAPTFRSNHSIEPYRINWPKLIPQLASLLKSDNITVLLRLHPNLIGKIDTRSLQNDSRIVDVTRYHDMQELLSISDLLITDYSSSMFDFAMQHRRCLLYAVDVDEYDRGYYFELDKLPFPLARNEEQLQRIIADFDDATYQSELDEFFTSHLGLCENGQAARNIAQWMESHRG